MSYTDRVNSLFQTHKRDNNNKDRIFDRVTPETNLEELVWKDSGISLPEESNILGSVVEDFQTAFGNTLNLYNTDGEFLLSTPQGQLISSIAAIISDRNRLLAYYVNQVDPSYAVGRMQDAIGRIYFIERIPAQNTKVVGICKGGTGVQIPKGTKVKDTSGYIYEADNTYIIGENGQVEVTFICTEEGAIACPAGTLTQMYQLIAGWDTVTNDRDGILGRIVESQAQFEQRRRQSVAKNSKNSVDSIMSSLLNLTNDNGDQICQDAYVVDNPTAEVKLLDVISLKPHSIYVCVAALYSTDVKNIIAQEIFRKKSPGCDMTGSQEVTITDDSGLYLTPPTYKIMFDFAKEIPVQIDIVIARPQVFPSDWVNQIKNAVMAAFSGQNGSERPRIGGQILASSFYEPIQKLGTWAKIMNLDIGIEGNKGSSVQMRINEMPTLSPDDIGVRFNG